MPYTLVADQPHQYLSTYDLPWLFYIWFLPPQFKERGGGGKVLAFQKILWAISELKDSLPTI